MPEQLTPENAHKAATVVNREHPEYGERPFVYNGQPSFTGPTYHQIGRGKRGFPVADSELKKYDIKSYK